MSTRYRQNFLAGTASGVLASTGQTTITGSNWPSSIPNGQYLPVTLNPGYFGATNATGPEIIYVTSVTSGVATVSRQKESSTLVSGNVPWVAGPLVSDFGFTNQINNGDFPSPTISGQILLSTASGVAPSWTPLQYVNFMNPVLIGAIEKTYIVTSGISGGIILSSSSASTVYYTAAATGNFTVTVTNEASFGATINVGQSVTYAILVTQGATPYVLTGLGVDGTTGGFTSGSTANNITTYWQGGSAPTAGNANGIDAYTFSVIKTGSGVYTILASQTKF